VTDHPWLDASRIQVDVQPEIVTLTGMVNAWAAKQRAKALTDRVCPLCSDEV